MSPDAAGLSRPMPRIERIVAEDGVRLALHRLGPDGGTPVLMVPGTFSNHTFWLGTRGHGFARAVADAGFEAWVLDPRGHGDSQRQGPGERWDFDDWGRLDVPAAVRAVRSRSGPCFLIGHSAGGASVLMALAAASALHPDCSGVVVLGTPLPWLQPVQRVVAHGVRLFSRVASRFPARLLGLGPEDELSGVMSQWMRWNLEGRWHGDDGLDYEALLGALRMPILGIAGAGDRIYAPPAACRALVQRLGSADRTLRVFGTDHGHAEDYDHAGIVVSRSARSEIWPVVVEWLRSRDPGGG